MSVEIRQAEPDDAALLHEVAAATFGLACPPHTTPDAIAHFVATNLAETSFASYLADSRKLVLMAEAEGALVGYAMVVFDEPHDPDVAAVVTLRPTVELSKFYIVQGQHGSGIAASLMEAVFSAARARSAAGVWLGVNQHNARANRFYEKHGFANLGTKRFLVGNRLENDFVRERVL